MIARVPPLVARARRHQYFAAAMLLGAIVAVFFSPIVRHHASYAWAQFFQETNEPWKPDGPPVVATRGDHPEFVYPRQVFLHDRLARGRDIPLWNPLTFGGSPFLAETGSRLAYPPYIALSWLLEPVLFHDVYVVAHVFVAAFAAFALMKTFGTRFAGALLTGVAWALCSYGLVYYVLEMYAPVAALLPLAVLLLRRWHDRRSAQALAGASLALGLLVLGTSAELALLSFMAVCAYAGALALSRLVAEWRTSPWMRRAGVGTAPIAFAGAALIVGAVALIPFLDLSSRSGRTATSYSFLEQNVPVRPADFLRSFRPPVLPLSLRTALSQQVFVGTAAAALAVVAFLRRRPGTGLGRTLLVVTFVVAATPLARVAYGVVPGLKSLNGFGRSLFLWCFGAAILAGIGLDVVLGALRRRLPPADAGTEQGSERGSFKGAPAVATVLAVGVLAATSWQLVDYGRDYGRFQPRDRRFFLPPTPATDATHAALGAGPGRARMLPLTAIRPDGITVPAAGGATTMALDLPSAGGYEPVLPERVSNIWRVLRGEPVDSVVTVPLRGTLTAVNFASLVRTDLLARMGIASLLAPPDVAADEAWRAVPLEARGLRQSYAGSDGIVYDVVDAVPRATFVAEAVPTRSGEDALRRFTASGFDPRRQVVLEDDPETAVGRQSPPSSTGPAEVDWEADQSDRVRVSVQAPEAGWLVLLDNWDAGWRATVGRRHVSVQRANYAFRAVPVPAGRSTVTFTYRPTPVTVAGWVTALGGLGLTGFLLWSWARQRPSRRGPRLVVT